MDRGEIHDLQDEVQRLRNVEALKAILEEELADLRHVLNEERLKNVELREAVEGLILDMSLMESRINELMGRLP